MRAVKDIRITDRYLRQRVEDERQLANEACATKTAGRLILERLAQLELCRTSGVMAATMGEGMGERRKASA